MAGIQPTFITGAAAKIKLNGKTLAFCQDFSCSVQILTKTPKVLGKYEGDSVEPLSYLVSGSFSVLRYAKGIRKSLGAHAAPSIAENDAGNGVGNWGSTWGGTLGDILAKHQLGNDGKAQEALDPSKFGRGTTFDIQIYQKVPKGFLGNRGPTINDITSILDGGTNSGPGNDPIMDYLGILNIRKARITQADFSLGGKRSVAIERYSFVALYADGDAYVANASGT